MSARRILLFLTDLQLGGTPTVVRELAFRLRAVGGAEVQVACLGGSGPVAEQLAGGGIPVTALAAVGPMDLRVLPRFVHLVREQRFDTVFSFLLHANAVAATASLFLRDVRWIQSVQTTQHWPRWHWMVQRLAHRAADMIVVPSPSAAAAAHHWAGVPAGKIVVVPNAIDPAEFPAVANDERRPCPVLFLGRLDPIKDVPTLVDAVSRLDGLVHLHIFGDGSDRRRIEQRIGQHNLSSLVTLHGQVDRPQTALSQGQILVLPSLAEGFGLVLIEAMASRIPVIATNVPGIGDVVRQNQTGLLVPPSDPASLATAIRQLVEDLDLRQRLIAAAADDVRRRWTWDSVMPQYVQLLHL